MARLAALLFVLACLCAPSVPGAAAGELDGLVFLSWSPTAVVDTLVVDGPGTVDCWLVVLAQEAPARFIEATGRWVFGPGLTPGDLEVLTDGNPFGHLQMMDHGMAAVRVSDFDCARSADPQAVARVTVDVDPTTFASGRATVTPVAPPAATATRLIFADYDPVLECVGQMDDAVIGPVTVLDAALPAGGTTFGALKARYR